MVWLKDGDVPPDKERCVRNDGKQWRCSKRRDGRAAMCEYHVQYSRRKSRTTAMKRKVEPRVRVPGKNLRAWTRKDGSSSEEESDGDGSDEAKRVKQRGKSVKETSLENDGDESSEEVQKAGRKKTFKRKRGAMKEVSEEKKYLENSYSSSSQEEGSRENGDKGVTNIQKKTIRRRKSANKDVSKAWKIDSDTSDDFNGKEKAYVDLGMSGESNPSDSEIGPCNGARKRRKPESIGTQNFRWSKEMGVFLIHFFAEQITSGLRGNNYAGAAKAVNDKFGERFSEAQVYNHLRTWRGKWNRILKCKKLSGCVVWVPETRTIQMPEAEYKVYIKANELDKPYLNKPIDMYDEMATIFGDEVASGKHVKYDSARLGNEPATEDFEVGAAYDIESTAQAGRSGDQAQSMSISQGTRGKGKRTNPQLKIMESLADSLKSIANHLHEGKEEEEKVQDECLKVLRGMVGTQYDYAIFNSEVVDAAYDFLVEHPKIAKGFLKRENAEKACWLYKFVKKN